MWQEVHTIGHDRAMPAPPHAVLKLIRSIWWARRDCNKPMLLPFSLSGGTKSGF